MLHHTLLMVHYWCPLLQVRELQAGTDTLMREMKRILGDTTPETVGLSSECKPELPGEGMSSRAGWRGCAKQKCLKG